MRTWERAWRAGDVVGEIVYMLGGDLVLPEAAGLRRVMGWDRGVEGGKAENKRERKKKRRGQGGRIDVKTKRVKWEWRKEEIDEGSKGEKKKGQEQGGGSRRERNRHTDVSRQQGGGEVVM